MANDKQQIHDVSTGEVIVVELTDEEQTIRDAEVAANLVLKKAEAAELKAKAKAKEAAQSKLAALGLTVEDLQALGLGGN